jgi:hypothetical protein
MSGGVNCLTEGEVLALSAAVSGEWARCTKDTEELMFWGEFLTAIGTNLIMMADQRVRREACKNKKKKTDSS